jgi:hypothetical protein
MADERPSTPPRTPPLPVPDLPDAALDYLRRRLLGRLERVARARRRWDAWEADARLPEARRRPVTEPVLDREALDGLHETLSEELARPDGSRRCAG